MQSSIFNFWKPITYKNTFSEKKIKNFILNFGPQHPASHGVLRLIVQLNGELVEKADPHVGFLHRGTEKLIESRNYIKSLPYFDRLDYVSMVTQEHAFCLAIESLSKSISYSSIYSQVRVLFDELTRILNHLLAISTHALDVGSMVPLFWAFEEREKIMEFYERVSGARMHAAFYRPIEFDITPINNQLLSDISFFLRDCFKSLTEIYITLSTNKIWKSRLVNIGSVNYNDVLSYGATGPISKSLGFKKDLRASKNLTYSFYWYLSFKIFLGKNGDCYDRFLIRMREMYESVSICYQTVNSLLYFKNNPNNFYLNEFSELTYQNKLKKNKYSSMESLINHFKHSSEGIFPKKGYTYQAVEAPKGEFGVSLISDGSNFPYRCKIRTPAYHHMQMMPRMVQGHYFADLVTVLGSQDIVFGDVDR